MGLQNSTNCIISTHSGDWYSKAVVIVHTKTHRPAGRCFQMPGGALGPGFPPRALPLPKNPEEYRKRTKYTEKSRKSREIPKNPGKKFALPGSASETRAIIRKPTITTGGHSMSPHTILGVGPPGNRASPYRVHNLVYPLKVRKPGIEPVTSATLVRHRID